MRTLFQWTLAFLALAVACWNIPVSAQDEFDSADWGGSKEQSSVLTINADGSCVFTTASVEARTTAEQRVRMLERYRKMSEAAAADPDTPKPDLTVTNDTKPFTDEELVKSITERMNERSEDADQKIKVEATKDSVITTTTRSFATLEEMLKESYAIWQAGSLAFENVRMEKDTNGLLRITFTPQSGMERYLKRFRSQWKLSGGRTELKLVFPGKVVSSGFPAMQTNATWVVMDAKKDESLDALAKLYTAPTVITAELGGLKADQPLESKKLWRSRRQSATGGDDLPITEAGPGFVAEAQSITTTTLHVFPGGEAYFKQSPVATGAVVNVKLFAPKGRTLKSVTDARVLNAVDDKGRSVMTEADAGEDASSEVGRFISSEANAGSGDTSSLQIELRLRLPQPDAQGIDKLSAEAVALTVSAWKEMTLTNLQAKATNDLDLSAVLPGASMAITKLTSKNGQFNLQANLKGSAMVKRLEVRAKIPDNDQFNSYSSDRQSRTKNGAVTRGIVVQGYGFSGQDASSQGAVVLIIRYPNDLKRERVKFELKGLDLL